MIIPLAFLAAAYASKHLHKTHKRNQLLSKIEPTPSLTENDPKVRVSDGNQWSRIRLEVQELHKQAERDAYQKAKVDFLASLDVDVIDAE
jgi:uncharacterized protein (UPF0216 family)